MKVHIHGPKGCSLLGSMVPIFYSWVQNYRFYIDSRYIKLKLRFTAAPPGGADLVTSSPMSI